MGHRLENLKFIKSVEILRRVLHPSMGGAGGGDVQLRENPRLLQKEKSRARLGRALDWVVLERCVCVRGKGKRVVGDRATQPRRAPPRRPGGETQGSQLGCAPLTRHGLVVASPRRVFSSRVENSSARNCTFSSRRGRRQGRNKHLLAARTQVTLRDEKPRSAQK